MDYWCALWFWPIEQADLLPSRTEFLFDLTMILEGTPANTSRVSAQSLFDEVTDVTQGEQLLLDFASKFTEGSIVDLDQLCSMFPRMELVRKIAEANKFMHWELEFAELFAERGGFDLIIGNPPWVLLGWNEQDVLSDCQPIFAIKKLNATQTMQQRNRVLIYRNIKDLYFREYEAISGQQAFLNATQNYKELVGMKANLYKCFLPQAWLFANNNGVSAFIHPDGVYDDPNGGLLRDQLYPKLRYHFQFTNERRLFEEVHHNTVYSLNIYCNEESKEFDSISNLFDPITVEQCYDENINGLIPGIKDENGWCISGHPSRVVIIGKEELKLFAKIFDGSDNWKQARIPVLHTKVFADVLECFANAKMKVSEIEEKIYTTVMWDETATQNNGIIKRNVHFPLTSIDTIEKFGQYKNGTKLNEAVPLFMRIDAKK